MSPDSFSRERWFLPRFTGHVRLSSVPADYVERLRRRVEEGFLVRANRTRANYVSQPLTDGGIRILANDYWTAANIGLNEVVLRRKDSQGIAFDVRFKKWHRYALLLCAAILAVGAVLYLVVSIMSWSRLAGAREATIGLPIALFFGLCWPWVLTEMHKKPAARCLTRILRETLED